MGLGLAAAAGSAGAYDTLDKMLAQRMAERAYQDHLKQQEFQNAIQTRGLDQNDELKKMQMDLTRQTAQGAQQDRQVGLANTLADQIPAGATLAPTDPAVGMLRTGGRGSLLEHQDPTLGSTQMTGGASLPGAPKPVGMVRTTQQAGNPEQYVKLASAKQADTTADNTRQQEQFHATADAKLQALGQQRQALEQRIAQAGESFQLRREMADLDMKLKEAKLEKDRSANTNTKTTTEATKGEVVKLVQELKSAPGMAGAVGVKGPTSLFGFMDTPISGTDAAGYVAKMERLKSLLTLDNIKQMRGMGALSDREGMMLARAATALDRNMPEKDFLAELNKLEFDRTGGGPVAPGGGGGVVHMKAPDGRDLSVPADKVAELERLGAKRQ